MSDKTTIDTDGARSTNARFRGQGSSFSDAVTRLTATVGSYDGCWGNDKFGQAFAKAYLPGAQDALKYSGQIPGNLKDSADSIEASIHSFETVDQNNANGL
ncbi:hypothetical protein [Kutzneria sp. 744]|uniref:hypothetical protein n=1 Tax=Kutzneria sp. (strain 744) TaxID=345341 RepID=UPI0005BB6E3C|nr:hypothetical protein [Kutzneria sp. 744]